MKRILQAEMKTKIVDPDMVSAYQKTLYTANSPTGRFRDSKGYKILMNVAYERQCSYSRVLPKESVKHALIVR